jgi:hypothetical protein
VSAAEAAGLARLRRRGFALEYASMAWMTAEAAVAVTAGVLASSVALAGFGLDSVIEFFAAAVVVWQLRGEGEERETRAVRLIGVTFFALALYLAVEGIRDLVTHARLGQSAPGLAVAGAALVVMPLLHRVGERGGDVGRYPARPGARQRVLLVPVPDREISEQPGHDHRGAQQGDDEAADTPGPRRPGWSLRAGGLASGRGQRWRGAGQKAPRSWSSDRVKSDVRLGDLAWRRAGLPPLVLNPSARQPGGPAFMDQAW